MDNPLSLSTNVTNALEVFFNDMHYINPRFTYLLPGSDHA